MEVTYIACYTECLVYKTHLVVVRAAVTGTTATISTKQWNMQNITKFFNCIKRHCNFKFLIFYTNSFMDKIIRVNYKLVDKFPLLTGSI